MLRKSPHLIVITPDKCAELESRLAEEWPDSSSHSRGIGSLAWLFCFLWLLYSFSSSAAEAVRHFRPVSKERFPRVVFEKEYCGGEEAAECWHEFRRSGGLWAADINSDGIDELLIRDIRSGSMGHNYRLYQKHERDWHSIVNATWSEGDEWLTWRPRFDILPRVRGGYSDLRIEVDVCVKWSGGAYVEYSPEDYHELPPRWFDATDSHEAEIFWAIRYAGRERFTFEPQWFPVLADEFLHGSNRTWRDPNLLPRFPTVLLDDPEQNIKWVSLLRGAVWGVRGGQGFLLCPQFYYLGAGRLKLKGDWLLVFESPNADNESDDDETERYPGAKYNRRTHKLQLFPENW